tara:strand:+ start:3263 stop:4999 length:1737 start_codon:yes stop_codon:yes gene_type:complete
MYLASLRTRNFRKLKDITLEFQSGLNILIGPNNIGKTAVVDGLRALLAGVDDPYPRFDQDDISAAPGVAPTGEIVFEYVFRDLSLEDEADFLPALRPSKHGRLEAVVGVAYGNLDKTGRLKPRRWCGEHEEVAMSVDMLENLRSVYLPPLRDAAQGLRPSRTSQLSRLMQLLSDEAGRDGITTALSDLDNLLKKHPPIVNTQNAIAKRHKEMLGPQLAQALQVGLSASDFQKLASRLSLLVDSLEIERNGLGYNNLIYMAVVLSELAKNADAAYRGLIVEEPEAHLHPQLQAVLLKYLSNIDYNDGERSVQVFVTSHSPNFASIAKLDSIACLVDTGAEVEAFHPRSLSFEKGKREKLERYLDVTRAELFFARRVIFVEGAAELLLVNVLASKADYDLREHGVSVISVEGLNFDSFMPLFGEAAMKVRVSVITDADPEKIEVPGAEPVAHYPMIGEAITVSANAASMKAREDNLVKVFYGVKTFEYDFALHEKNRKLMLAALADIHPRIAVSLATDVGKETTDRDKARTLFRGMFERSEGNVQKGRFAQALAARVVEKTTEIVIPEYIRNAIKHACSA